MKNRIRIAGPISMVSSPDTGTTSTHLWPTDRWPTLPCRLLSVDVAPNVRSAASSRAPGRYLPPNIRPAFYAACTITIICLVLAAVLAHGAPDPTPQSITRLLDALIYI